MSKKYSIGVDFGTLSGRALLVDLETGNEIAVESLEYAHAVMDQQLPSGKKLGANYALQHPNDYLEVLKTTIPNILKKANVSSKDVVGVGIDFTACTVIPVKEDGTPLCFMDKYIDEPHAYVKLWKHHAAQKEANYINELAEKREEDWIKRYGGKISSEWMFPKILNILNENEEIYNETDRFIEAGDWVVWMLTGKETHSSCMAGYKGMWNKRDGYPSKEFFKELNPLMENIVGSKVSDKISSIGSKAGEIDENGAKLTGLEVGTPVAIANVDAHVAFPAVGISDDSKMLMIMGTSTCHIIMDKKEYVVPGVCGVVEDGVMPGYFGYEAGQACVGDHFDWFVKNCVPEAYMKQAQKEEISIHKFLREKAKKLDIGESGLLALDWWNGNRSVLVDANLTGLIMGMTLQTKPEEIYRTLIEATAYGTKMIIDTFEENGVEIKELYAAGGIAEKDEFMMQIYADVTGREIKISGSPQAPALGSAVFGAAVSDYFDSMEDAINKMSKLKNVVYTPKSDNVKKYNKLYEQYKKMHDYFGKGGSNIMKELIDIKENAGR